MNQVNLLYDPKYKVKYIKRGVEHNLLFITFSDGVTLDSDPEGFGHNYFSKRLIDSIQIQSSCANYYWDLSKNLLFLKHIENCAKPYKKIFFYGSSMGAIGAILFQTILGFENSANILLSPRLPKFSDLSIPDEIKKIDYDQLISGKVAETYIYISLFDVGEIEFLDRLNREFNASSIYVQKVPCAHPVTRLLSESRNLSIQIDSVLNLEWSDSLDWIDENSFYFIYSTIVSKVRNKIPPLEIQEYARSKDVLYKNFDVIYLLSNYFYKTLGDQAVISYLEEVKKRGINNEQFDKFYDNYIRQSPGGII